MTKLGYRLLESGYVDYSDDTSDIRLCEFCEHYNENYLPNENCDCEGNCCDESRLIVLDHELDLCAELIELDDNDNSLEGKILTFIDKEREEKYLALELLCDIYKSTKNKKILSKIEEFFNIKFPAYKYYLEKK